ncbi:MAG: CoA ester lyase [Frankiales bacterium]|nr:CoA ester lyase [Frankiales bacterium]
MTLNSAAFDLGPAILFCPAERPERYEKALERADAVILDLEDAVAAADKDAGRAALLAHPIDPSRVIVRVNGFATDEFEADLAALRKTGYTRVMLPKASSAPEIDALRGYDVIALCETAAGILAAPQIAAVDHVVALMWGAEDLVASLGGTSSRREDGEYRDVARFARSAVLLAAAANDTAAIDSVYLDIADVAGLGAEARDAVAVGFAATACIHPSQVAVIREAYAPTPAQVEQARALLAAASGAHGVFTFEGQMVDEPVLRHARAVVARAR